MEKLFKLSCAEPFRVFFPLGLLIAIGGISLWPLYQLHLIETYPAVPHARLMIQGFLASFVFGFLGTAGPRLMSAAHFRPGELILLLFLELALILSHLSGYHRTGDLLFLILLLFFIGLFATRVPRRQGLPPPSFVLVLFGLVNAVLGCILLLTGRWPFNYSLGYLLLYQGFVLFPMLGIGRFLFPRFLGLPHPPPFPDSAVADANWIRQASAIAAAGVIILISFFLEAAGYLKLATILRFTSSLYLLRDIFKGGKNLGTLALALRYAIILMLAGLLLPLFLPTHRIAAFHVVAVGGFGLITFLVATRVMFGHSGIGEALKQPAPFIAIMTVLTTIALVLRFTADYQPLLKLHWIAAGAICWIAAALVWGARVVPRVFVPDPEEYPPR